MTALVLAATALLAAGCASDAPTRPSVDRNGGFDRSEMVPSEVTAMREQLASQRNDTMEQMNASRPESVEMETHSDSDPIGVALDAFGWAAGRAADVLSLRAFGLW